ncbi:MAG: malto-oligosyltrehalose synthase [Chloroflexota bacterium]
MPVEPRATYRVQLSAGFTLDDAAGLVEYLQALGVSHLYASPFLQAAAGSTHGYDVVNYQQVNSELGGSEAFARLSYALMQAGMGLLMDMVPNHMAVDGGNPWWQDVLENGPSSPYASHFDVEWDPPEARHSNAVLLPVLGDHYGRVLEAGELRLLYDGQAFQVSYHAQRFPLDPRSLGQVLARAALRGRFDELTFIANAFARLPMAPAVDRLSARRRSLEQRVLHGLLARLADHEPGVRQALDAVVEEYNQSPDLLDELLAEQNYRLAFWRITSRELGYRRFFNINSLIGMRMEDPAVYEDAHALVLGWLHGGLLDGLRIDHPDGMRDPQGYFERLRQDNPHTWIVVEKILEPGEALPAEWPVDGTTGYDFLNLVNQLLVDPAGEAPLEALFTRFTGRALVWDELALEKKRFAAVELLGSDLARLAALLLQVSQRHRRHRDYIRLELRAALAELAAALPVYRTYLRPGQPARPADLQALALAVQRAAAARPDLDPQLFDFLGDLLALKHPGEPETELALRFQQFSGPLMAKGVEDTAFYIYNRLVSLNEVGGDPGQFGLAVEEFHQRMAQAGPLSLLAGSTHDTKRSEDVRARLSLLSEAPGLWGQAVERWWQLSAARRSAHPLDPDDEYLLYQTLVGAWPIDAGRAAAYLLKAAREARRSTSWDNPDPAYEAALTGFVEALFADAAFTAELEQFAAGLRSPGRLKSLAQTLLKLTAPGVPDLYQGAELWDLSLVDPDNRRPVDYDLRRRLLGELAQLSPAQALEREDEGLPKLWLVHRALAVRRELPEAFGPQAAYTPLAVQGAAAAYLRGDQVAVVAPLRAGWMIDLQRPRRLAELRPADWPDGPAALPAGGWRSLLSGARLVSSGQVWLADLLGGFPVGLWVRDGAG